MLSLTSAITIRENDSFKLSQYHDVITQYNYDVRLKEFQKCIVS